MNAMRVVIAAVCLVLTLGDAFAAPSEPPAGATACTGCHPASPKLKGSVASLIGRKPEEIIAAMQAFRSGQHQSTVMERVAKGFSDDEVRAIAEWYGAQHP